MRRRSAKTLLAMVGVEVSDDIRCIVFEGEKEHPLISEELMMPHSRHGACERL